MERAHGTAALHQRNNLFLVDVAALGIPQLADLGLLGVAPVGFIGLYGATARAEQAFGFRLHGFADAVAHEPGCLVGHAQHALQLL